MRPERRLDRPPLVGMQRGHAGLVEGWGAYWINGLSCGLCDEEWMGVYDNPNDGPLQDQFLTLHLLNYDIEICPICADNLVDQIAHERRANVPMGMQEADTLTTCALPDDFYIGWIMQRETFWDDDECVLRYSDDDTLVKVSRDQYRAAKRELRKSAQAHRKESP